jgi:hypothetical protein
MNLIKSKKRVADHGEVFTPQWLVDKMLDLVKGETPIRIGGGLPLSPLLHINRGQTSGVILSSIYVSQSTINVL